MTQQEIQRLQDVQLMIMDEIHRVCLENDLRYYLIGGSALGAVRHGGMIPWDIDIDIAMPRKDYELFSTDKKNQLSDNYEFHDYRTDKEFGTVHALVVLKDSELLFKNDIIRDRHNRFGIFVDILPLDQWPDDNDLKISQVNQIKMIRIVREYFQGAELRNDSLIKKILKKFIKIILHLKYSQYAINEKQQLIVSRYCSKDEGKEWCSMLSHYSLEKLTFPKEVFGTPRLLPFSNREFFVPEQVEVYLRQLFGDYMKEPSIDKQKEQMESVYRASWKDDNGVPITILNQ